MGDKLANEVRRVEVGPAHCRPHGLLETLALRSEVRQRLQIWPFAMNGTPAGFHGLKRVPCSSSRLPVLIQETPKPLAEGEPATLEGVVGSLFCHG